MGDQSKSTVRKKRVLMSAMNRASKEDIHKEAMTPKNRGRMVR